MSRSAVLPVAVVSTCDLVLVAYVVRRRHHALIPIGNGLGAGRAAVGVIVTVEAVKVLSRRIVRGWSAGWSGRR